MKKSLLSSILFLLLFQNNNITSQIDTSFWFAAPFVTPDHWWRDDIKLHISTFSAPTTTVRVRQPGAIAPNKYDTTIVIGPNSTFDYIFWRDKLASLTNIGYDSLETRPSNTVVPYGLYISSSSNITVVYDVITRAPNFYNPETFSLKGQNALGTNFMCPFQTKQNNATVGNLGGTPPGVILPKQQINIVASKVNTTVSITPKCNVVGHPANITYTISLLNPGDAYTIENMVQNTNVVGNNLAGTEITSNKPISVTVADDSMFGVVGGCYDLIGDQIVPTNVIGKEHIIIKGFLNAPENEGAFILATQNNTTLTIVDVVVTNTIINKGDTYFYKATQDLTYIKSDKSVYCLQLTGNGCEYGSDIVAPLNCSGSNLVSFSRNTAQNFYLHILCKNGVQNSFTLNNSTSTVTVPITAANFSLAPGTATMAGGPYYGARLSLASTTLLPLGSYTIANSADVFALGVFDGGISTGGLFHYMSSFLNGVNVAVTSTLNSICVSPVNTIALSGNVSGSALTGTWTTQNGSGVFAPYSSTLSTISTTYSLSNADTLLPYVKFYLTAIGSCNTKSDSITIQIYQRPQITVAANFSISNIVPSITLSGTITNAVSGMWNGGNGGIFAGSGPITTYTPNAADFSIGTGLFALTTQSALPGCSNSTKSITVTFLSAPVINLVAIPPQICVGQTASMSANGAANYTWTPVIPINGIVSPIANTSYTVVASAANTSTNMAVITLTVDLCTDVVTSGATETNSIKIYPNPSTGIFNISCNTISLNMHVEVVNALGQLLFDQKINSENTSIDLSKYAKAIYYLKVIGTDKQEVFKIIKE